MTGSDATYGIEQNRAFKKQMLDKHRPAFEVWLHCAQLLEESVVIERRLDSAFARALDLFFIEMFKSHQSLYPLCVMGHGDDAATIARRLFEIALQVGYLCSAESEQRGAIFLAHFWHTSKELAAVIELPEDRRLWWEEQYRHHKHLLRFNKKGDPATYWFGSNFAQLAEALGLKKTYDEDYRFLSHVAHCSSRGLLLDKVDSVLQIKTDRLIREILIFGTRYALWVAAHWNEHFGLIDAAKPENVRDEALGFNFKA